MPKQLLPEEFLKQAQHLPIIDVRSPAEWEQGHIPGSFNIPLFSNEERVKVGTLYKNSGKENAVDLGLEIVGPKMASFVKQAKQYAKDRKILVHCWRGGMRSASMAWLFEIAALETSTLIGGYKNYRKYIRDQFEEEADLIVLGGSTGSGKTDILKAIEAKGEQFLDIEGIAHHKGSAFGTIGQKPQLSNEHFENKLAQTWLLFDKSKQIWIEDESRNLGVNSIPDPLFKQMRTAKLWRINIPKEMRIKRLVKEYAFIDKGMLTAAIHKIERRLGGLKTQQCLEAIESENYALVADLTLDYYDKGYNFGNAKRDQNKIINYAIERDEPEETAQFLLDRIKSEF